MDAIHVALAPEVIGHFLGVPITNTLLMSWVVIALLGTIGILVSRNTRLIPGKFQAALEWAFEYVFDYVAETLESREMARKYFPFLMTIFLFIFTANLIEFTPGIGSIGFFVSDERQERSIDHVPTEVIAQKAHETAEEGYPPIGQAHKEFIPLLRSVNTDLNVTETLAIIAFTVVEITGFLALGVWKYLSKFLVNPFRRTMDFAVGIIELIGEFVRLISLSFRLFGNILAGEVLIVVATFFAPYFGPVPLMMFELFIGFLQAAIFMLLTLFYIKLAITEPHSAGEHGTEAAAH